MSESSQAVTGPSAAAVRPIPAAPRIGRLARKELREILRDRRTIITLVLMPILVYPLLGVTFQKFLVSQLTATTQVRFRIALASQEDAERFGRAMRGGDAALQDAAAGAESADEPTEEESAPDPGIEFFVPTAGDAALETAVENGDVHLAIRRTRLSEERLPGSGRPARYELLYAKNSRVGQDAYNFVERRLRASNEAYIKRLLAQSNLPTLLPATVTAKEITVKGGGAYSLATLVPLVLILMTVTGAVYPAIDLTAGERERGTLETLIAAPVSRLHILFAKYIAVLSVAILTAIANLLAMSATMYSTGLDRVLLGEEGIPLIVILQIFGLLVVLAGFFSAALLCLTSFARSFKEAQAYLIPLMLVSLAPGILSLMPGLQMNVAYALIPLVNIVLLSRDLLEGNLVPVLALIAILSTFVYAAVSLMFAARVFGTDSVLYGGEETWSDLFARNYEVRKRPSIASAVACLGIILPAFIFLSGVLGRAQDLSMGSRLFASGTITIALFVVAPICVALFSRVMVVPGFRLHAAPVLTFVAAMLLGVSLWPFAYELELLQLDEKRIQALRAIFEQLKIGLQEMPLAAKLLALAVIPAACEEFFFRGYLLNALLGRVRPYAAVLISAIVFGAFHVIVRDALLFERFGPSTLMGLFLGWVAIRSGSVLPGMLLHVLHNGLLLTIAHFEKDLGAMSLGGDGQQHLPSTWLLGAAIVAAVGVILLVMSTRRRRRTAV